MAEEPRPLSKSTERALLRITGVVTTAIAEAAAAGHDRATILNKALWAWDRESRAILASDTARKTKLVIGQTLTVPTVYDDIRAEIAAEVDAYLAQREESGECP